MDVQPVQQDSKHLPLAEAKGDGNRSGGGKPPRPPSTAADHDHFGCCRRKHVLFFIFNRKTKTFLLICSDDCPAYNPKQEDKRKRYNNIGLETPQSDNPYPGEWVFCEWCETLQYLWWTILRKSMCEHCEFHMRMNSRERIKLLIDPDTWAAMNEDMVSMPELFESDDEPFWNEDMVSMPELLESDEEPFSNEDMVSMPELFESDDEPFSNEDMVSMPELLESDEEPFSNEDMVSMPELLESDEEPFSNEDMVSMPELLESDEEPFSEVEFDNEPKGQDRPREEEGKEEIGEDLSEEEIAEEEDLSYKDKIDLYQEETGLNDAIQTGTGKINGISVALGAMDFDFIGGSMGAVVGEKITLLIEYATTNGLPLILVCASGGARMQEGIISLMQMGKIASSLLSYKEEKEKNKKKKLYYIPIFTSPTTGGVIASFGMLGDISIAEPNATIAFTGKIITEEILKIEIPEGIQETEYLFEQGAFDMIVPRTIVKQVMSELFKFHFIFALLDP
uniref:Acetyl-coenzyme A carboxylase carboxyl transferase subunit beta, chloroplastic n=1 Tax=Viviania marifolia TaxID=28971 RepID=V9P7J1_VIVMA|nr:acetyl-CoA carboxylase carboxyltransferase beta subunit [Viviania marifolia]AGV02833.1 acetyl-CoA carboxylase carboxyltransferase beta subunit [Viviania marifolia]